MNGNRVRPRPCPASSLSGPGTMVLPCSVPRRALPAPGPRLACVLRWPFQGLLQTEKSFSARGGDTWLHLPEKGRLLFVKCSVLSNKSVMVYGAAKATEPQQTNEPPFTGLGPCCGLFTQEYSSPATALPRKIYSVLSALQTKPGGPRTRMVQSYR